MNKYVVDTMALVLHLENRKRPAKIKRIFQAAEKGEVDLLIPSMVFAEIGYLSAKGKIDVSLENVEKYLKEHPCIREIPLSLEIVKSAFQLSAIPELHDKLIAAVSLVHSAQLLTNDPTVEKSVLIETIWS